MKRIINLVIVLIAIIIPIKFTSAFFTTNSNYINVFKSREYRFKVNASGGRFNNTSLIILNGNRTVLPVPEKTGYTFIGYGTKENGDVKYSTNIDNVTLIEDLYAIWSTNSYQVDINPIIDGITYGNGLSGYTFNVWINDVLRYSDLTDWCENVEYGTKIRIKTNPVTGRNTNYDYTFTVGASNVQVNPTWSTNTYESHFYLNGVHRLTTYNKFGAYIQTPNVSVSDLGYDSNFYYIGGYSPWESWYQPDRAVGFTINISEYNCSASFGSAGNNNNSYQLSKLNASGYNFCVNEGWAVVCSGNYSKVMNLYNKAWDILPRSGNGYSIYKQIGCDSGWSNVARR